MSAWRSRSIPGVSLFKPNDQWDAIVNGLLDMTAFPPDCASPKVGAFSATLMPGLVRNHERARRLNQSDFTKEIKAKIDRAGAMVLADAWLGWAVASRRGFAKLNKAQQDVPAAAGNVSEACFDRETKAMDEQRVEAFRKAGVEAVTMTRAEYDAWVKVAQDSSRKRCAGGVPDGRTLIDAALA